MCNRYPNVTLEYEVVDADEVGAGEAVTMSVKLERDNDAASESEHVHAPLYPKEKEEGWWLLVGDTKVPPPAACPRALSPSRSLSLLSLALSLALSLSCALSLAPSLAPSLACSLSLSCFFSLSLTFSLSLALSRLPSLSRVLSLSRFLSLYRATELSDTVQSSTSRFCATR